MFACNKKAILFGCYAGLSFQMLVSHLNTDGVSHVKVALRFFRLLCWAVCGPPSSCDRGLWDLWEMSTSLHYFLGWA